MKDNQGIRAACMRYLIVMLLLVCATTIMAIQTEFYPTTHGTLIVLVQTHYGFVVASDSRAMQTTQTGPLKCDDAAKMFPFTNHERTILLVTGTSSINPGAAFYAKSCSEIKPDIVFGKQIRNYLETQKGELSRPIFESSHKVVLEFFSHYHGNIVGKFHRGFLTVALAHYDPKTEKTILGDYSLCLENGHVTEICESSWELMGQEQVVAPKTLGVSECFNAAYTLEGRKKLGPGYFTNVDQMPANSLVAGKMSPSSSLKIATDIIEATAKYTAITDCERDSVGGPIRAYLVDADHEYPFALLPSGKPN